jgi:hypothetical protein
MAHKTLLTEGEIRQFLKLANLKNVGDDKIQEYGGMMPGERDEEAVEDAGDMPPMADDAMDMADDADAMADAADDMADDADDMDMGAMGGMDDVEREAVLADVVAAVAQALGIEDRVDIEAGEEAAGDDMDAAMAVDEPADDMGDLDVDLGAPEGGDAERSAGMGDDDEEEPVQMSEDEIVAEVARRVALRLKEEKSRDNMADVLAERIMKRLTNK